MNKKQSIRLRHVGTRMATIKPSESLEIKQLSETFKKTTSKGEIEEVIATWTTHYWKPGSARFLYKKLKRTFKSIPHPQREDFMDKLEQSVA